MSNESDPMWVIANHLAKIEATVTGHTARFDQIDARFDRLEAEVRDMKTEMRNGFDRVSRIEALEAK